MPKNRVYINTLKPLEISERLSKGEIIYHETEDGCLKMVGGLLTQWIQGELYNINPSFRPKNAYLYFEDEDDFQITVGENYRTFEGKKATICFDSGEPEFPLRGVVEGYPHLCFWKTDGKVKVKEGEKENV